MATCEHCYREMKDERTVTCVFVPVNVGEGELFDPLPYPGPGRCHDCNVAPGGYHHPGCDMESCPRCGGQLISCGCLFGSGGKEKRKEV